MVPSLDKRFSLSLLSKLSKVEVRISSLAESASACGEFYLPWFKLILSGKFNPVNIAIINFYLSNLDSACIAIFQSLRRILQMRTSS